MWRVACTPGALWGTETDYFVYTCTMRCYNHNEDKRLCVECVSMCLVLLLFCVLIRSNTWRYNIHWSRFSIKFFYYFFMFFLLDVWVEAFRPQTYSDKHLSYTYTEHLFYVPTQEHPQTHTYKYIQRHIYNSKLIRLGRLAIHVYITGLYDSDKL